MSAMGRERVHARWG